MSQLKPISTAPWDRLVLVSGPSGYSTNQRFYTAAYRDQSYRGSSWLEVDNNRLSDCGWEPDSWMELPQ